VHGANRLASNSLLESLVFAWRAVDALDAAAVLVDTAPARPIESAVYDRRAGGARADAPTRADIQNLMWAAVGLERDATALRASLATLDSWQVTGETLPELENRNLLDLARIVAHAALVREESRGAHDRSDAPGTRDEWRHSLVWTLDPATLPTARPAAVPAPVTSEVPA
jgi:L-aspartate oxidase